MDTNVVFVSAVINGKKISKRVNRSTFKPRATVCVKVNRQGEFRPNCPFATRIALSQGKKNKQTVYMENDFFCNLFGWQIKVDAGKKDAVCSLTSEGLPFVGRMTEEEAADAERNSPLITVTTEQRGAHKKTLERDV